MKLNKFIALAKWTIETIINMLKLYFKIKSVTYKYNLQRKHTGELDSEAD